MPYRPALLTEQETTVAVRDTYPVGYRVSSPNFVGRAEELELLDAAFERVTGGRTATVLIGGDAGIGKTRLVEEFCRRARDRGALVAMGVCVPSEGGGLPFGPVVGIRRDLARQLGESATAAMLSPTGAGPADASSSGSRTVDEFAKTRLFESVLICFQQLAERSPVVLVFEDLQWADSASTELLDYLARNLSDARALFIGTYRTEELVRDHPLRPWLTELGRHARVTPLGLDGFDRDTTAGLIAGILGHRPDWALAEAVWARSQGNPFFAEELTAARHSPSLSAELQGVIMTRVEALSKDAQQLLRLVATAGPLARQQLLEAVGVLDGVSLDGALSESIDKQLLVVDPTEAGYRFRHALLREAVDASLLPGERSRLHRQVATALQADRSLGPEGPGHWAAELAGHWWAAGEWTEAFTASVSAADAAVAAWGFPEALAHLEHALSALDRMPAGARPPDVDRVRLLERAADIAYFAGANQRAVDLTREAIDSIDLAADPVRGARCYTLLSRNSWGVGDSEAAFDAYRRAVALLPADAPSVELARVMAEEARGLMIMSRLVDAERRCHEAIAVAVAVGARAEEGHALNTLGCCRGCLGHYDEGIALVRESLVIAEELASPDDLNRAYGNLSCLLVDSGRLEEGAALVFDSVAVGEQLWGVRLNGAAGNSADALVRLGRYDEAEALLAEVGDHALGVCVPAPYVLPAPIAIRRGHFDEADRLLARADELTAAISDVQQRGTFHMLMAEAALEQGRPEDASEQIERALALTVGTDDRTFGLEMRVLGVRALADRVEASRTTGRHFDATKARVLALELLQETERISGASEPRGPRTTALTSTCAAEHSRLHGSHADLWQQAVTQWEALREPYPAAYCRWREAEALLEGGAGRSRASESLQLAWEATVKMGALPLKEKIERLARRARIPLRDISDTAPTDGSTLATDLGLTQREVEVLGQLAAGRTDREIAESLFISKKTVSVHVSNLLRKLDVTNRVEAGRVGQAHGLR